jgi:hypothetical protein
MAGLSRRCPNRSLIQTGWPTWTSIDMTASAASSTNTDMPPNRMTFPAGTALVGVFTGGRLLAYAPFVDQLRVLRG